MRFFNLLSDHGSDLAQGGAAAKQARNSILQEAFSQLRAEQTNIGDMAGTLVHLDVHILEYLKKSGFDPATIIGQIKDPRPPAERFSAIMERHFSDLTSKDKSERAQGLILQEAMGQMVTEGADIGEMAEVLSKMDRGFKTSNAAMGSIAETSAPARETPKPKPAPKSAAKASPRPDRTSEPDSTPRSRRAERRARQAPQSGTGGGRVVLLGLLAAVAVIGAMFGGPILSALSGKSGGVPSVYQAFYAGVNYNPPTYAPPALNDDIGSPWGDGRIVYVGEIFGTGGGCIEYGQFFTVVEYKATDRALGDGPWSDDDVADILAKKKPWFVIETDFDVILAHSKDSRLGLERPIGYQSAVFLEVERAKRLQYDKDIGMCWNEFRDGVTYPTPRSAK
ncbi:MAG: hypothetical protein AAF641_14060 [Pseudomonadota bacterium]